MSSREFPTFNLDTGIIMSDSSMSPKTDSLAAAYCSLSFATTSDFMAIQCDGVIAR